LPWPAPVGPSTSSSIGRWAAKPTISQQIGVGVLLHKHAKHYHLVGHRWCLESGWSQQPDPTGDSSLTTARPLARYNAMGGALREQLRYRRATPSQGTRPRPGCGLSQTETSNRPSCAFRVRAFTAVSLFFRHGQPIQRNNQGVLGAEPVRGRRRSRASRRRECWRHSTRQPLSGLAWHPAVPHRKHFV